MPEIEFSENIKQSAEGLKKSVKKNPLLWGGAAVGVVVLALYARSQGDAETVYYAGYPNMTGEYLSGSGTEVSDDSYMAELAEMLENMVSFEDLAGYQEYMEQYISEMGAGLLGAQELAQADIAAQYQDQLDYYENLMRGWTQDQAQKQIPAVYPSYGYLDDYFTDLTNIHSNQVISFKPDGTIQYLDTAAYYESMPEWVQRQAAIGRQEVLGASAIAAGTLTGLTESEKMNVAGLSAADIEAQWRQIDQNPDISFGARDVRNLGISKTSGGGSSSGGTSSGGTSSGGSSSGSTSSGGGSSGNRVTVGSHTYTKNADGSITKTTPSTGRTVTVAAGSSDMKYIPKSAGGTG